VEKTPERGPQSSLVSSFQVAINKELTRRERKDLGKGKRKKYYLRVSSLKPGGRCKERVWLLGNPKRPARK